MLLVGAVPTSTSTVTLYTAVPLQIAGASALTAHGTDQIDVSALGIKTDSAGTETTYSIGEYVSAPRFTTTVTEEGFTETLSLPGTTLTENCEMNDSNKMLYHMLKCFFQIPWLSQQEAIRHRYQHSLLEVSPQTDSMRAAHLVRMEGRAHLVC